VRSEDVWAVRPSWRFTPFHAIAPYPRPYRARRTAWIQGLRAAT